METKPAERTSTYEELAQEYLQRHARVPYKRASSMRNNREVSRQKEE
jgi:hypothetical protein